jgi:OOP family OmpA-OmpF porin
MKKMVALLCLLASLGVLQSAVALNRPGAVTITPDGSYYAFSNKRQLNNPILPGIALAYNFDERWAIEGSYNLIHSSYNTANLSGSTHGQLYLIDGLYRLGSYYHMVEPYVSGGLGVLSLSRNINAANSQVNLNAALGTQIFFSDSIALRGEVRDLYTMSGGKNDVMTTVGVSFLIGGEVASVVTPAPVSYK